MAHEPGDGSDVMGLAWLQDWSGVLFASGSAQRRQRQCLLVVGRGAPLRLRVERLPASLSDFNATPGEQGGVAISSATKAARLARPASPPHPTATRTP